MSLDKWLAQQDSGDVALGAGATTFAGGTMGKGLWDLYRDKKFMEGKGATRSYDDFIKKLNPGDILFHRKPTDFSGKADAGQFELPMKESSLMLAGKGDAYYHPSVYEGKGNVIHAEDWEKGVTKRALRDADVPEEFLAMRPSKESAATGLHKARSLQGTPYKGEMRTLQHGLAHLAGKTKKTGAIDCGKNGLVCSEFVAESFPDIFKDRNASPRDMKTAKGLEFAARYSPSTKGITLGDKLLQYGAYPALKTAKWAALAAGLGYGATELSKYLAQKEGV